jgi:cytochrome P450
MMMVGLKLELPIIYHILNTIPLPWVERAAAAAERLEKAGEKAVQNTKEAPKGSTKTLFSKMYPEDGEQPFSDELMAREASNIIIAGADTTAITLTYLVYEVIQHPEVKKKLLDELASCSEKPSWEELESKQYLNNVIQETLRLRPAVGALPRITPAQGAVLGGHKIPGGTIVLTEAYITHRDPVVFQDPEQFKPERWNEPTPEMKAAFMAFGGSARVCLGQNVAKLELLHAVSSFFRECPNCELAAGMTAVKMKALDFFTMTPAGGVTEITINE